MLKGFKLRTRKMDLFADRLGAITVANGVVRMDFLRLKEINQDTKQAELEKNFRLAIPLEGTMQAIEVLEKMKQDLLMQVKNHE